MKFLNKLKQFFETIKILLKSQQYVIYTITENNTLNKFEKNINNMEEYTYVNIINDMKMSLMNNICNGMSEIYSLKLELYDPDLYQAYKELNYLDAKNQYLEAEYMYYKDMNSPSNITANAAYKLYERVQQLKLNYLELEKRL